jgi:hypothetical protein
MNAASLTSGHRALDRLVGFWAGEEVMHASPWAPAGTARGAFDAELVCGGLYLRQSYRQEREGAESFSAQALHGVDPQSGEALSWWFDTAGFPPLAPARGGWAGDALTLSLTTPRGVTRRIFRLEAENRLLFDLAFSADGGDAWTPVLSGSYRRR